MNRLSTSLIGVAAALAAALAPASAKAAELHVISAGALRTIIGGMIEDYSRKTGHKFIFTIGPTGHLRAVIASGERADLIIVSAPLMAELEKSGKLAPGSRVDLGRIGLGVVIRDGAPAPDVSTPEALKQTLIKAKSIAYTDPAKGGTSVIHLMKIADRFGITDIVIKKGVFSTGGNDSIAKVAEGKAEIAVVLISETASAKGARLAAPLPEELQHYTVYAAAIPISSSDPATARAFIAALTAPEMRAKWKAAGWQPAN
ncbi:MAG TPA: substrate-binding domain-containing protein [Xanthobacteraceae bacterium]|nr:substrate-binding domain-containing protein [Xanthobacteraceae bacterium]